MSDARPALSAALAAFGVPATVTPPGGDSIETTAIWLPPAEPGEGFHPAERKRVLALPVAGLDGLPSGTMLSAPETLGAEAQDWRVNEVERVDAEFYQVAVEPTQ